MWRFLRLLLALILAFFLTMIIGGVLIVGALFTGIAIKASQTRDSDTPKEGWLYLPLAGELREYEREAVPSFSIEGFIWGSPTRQPPTMEEMRKAIQAAISSDKVKGIILHLGALNARPAQLQQIGRWLLTFKQKSNKPIYAYGDYFSELTYYLAAYADTIIMYPRSGASLEWNGFVAEGLFFKKFLQKWGIKPRLFRTGSYKSAAESFTEEKYSEENRAQQVALLEDIWGNIIDTIAYRRRIPIDSLRRWTDSRIFFSSAEARSAGFVDTLLPWHAWIRRFIPKGKDKPAFIEAKQLAREKSQKSSDNKVAIIYAEGGIGPEDDIQAENLVPVIEKLAQDDKVKAVVLRVNSPGGAVLDSDKIAEALRSLRANKPFIVSMSGVAASGGYYISALANKIVAEPTTITGSIGVIALLLDYHELLEKYAELRSDRVYVGGQYADFMNPRREARPEEEQRLQTEINQIYEEFLSVVKEGRRFPSRDAVHAIAQGRVWSGVDALDKGLVDTLGGVETAIALAAQAAGLSDFSVETYPEPMSIFERFFKDIQQAQALWARFRAPAQGPATFQMYWEELNIR
ncbi:MAG: signal peptide peptidase SppA [Bacteroidia bacterium]|nr:signal peptide peptidase SppA [Bacteroidia bacterium]MCX7652629.1 signal peptide peptidase SppA [Bacteroidia bacterium]MDW8417018.1 signal peptide peptidase SppA [Bacteroidia bacterium]